MIEEPGSELIGGGKLSGGGFGLVWESPVKRRAPTSSCAEVDDRSGTSCKRIKPTQVNGFIVYTRTKKPKLNRKEYELTVNLKNKSLNRLEKPKPFVIITNTSYDISNGHAKAEADVNPLIESTAIEEHLAIGRLGNNAEESFIFDVVIKESEFVEMVDEEITVEALPEGTLDFDVDSMRNESRIVDELCCSSAETECRGRKRIVVGSISRNHIAFGNSRRVQRSVNVAELNCNIKELDEQYLYGNLKNNTNLINKRPMTAKELFDTGVLDGVSVVYMGSVKSQAFGLRGVIKDGGILCSCSLCNWTKVIPTSKFEIHACKQYRRASQYICFENGKSLLDVLKVCRSAPLHALEEAICDAVSGEFKQKSFTCKLCKVLYPLSHIGNKGLLCTSCASVARTLDAKTIARTSKSSQVGASSPSKSQLKITRKSPESTPGSPVFASPLRNSPQKITRKVLHQPLVGKAYVCSSASVSSRQKCSSTFKNMSTHQSVTPKTVKITKKDHSLHKLVFQSGGLPDGTELVYYARGKKLLEGYKKGSGIFCYCCNSEVSPSQFEAHAGWASRRKPYAYIYTSNNVSLHEWAMTFAHGRKYSAKDNDDLCVVCADGGDLLLCDSCPRAFHIECINLQSVPSGNWHCKYCDGRSESDMHGEHGLNSVAAGRFIGVDPDDHVATRCIRVVKNMETDTSGCVLCSGSDFSRSGFGPRTIIICDQCEKEYHIGCLRSQKLADLKELPKGKWFCSMDCTRIHSALRKLLLDGPEKLSGSSLEVIRMKQEQTDLDTFSNIDIRWRLVSGKVVSPESRELLSQALAIFHDCFDPIVDPVSGRNLIPRMVYGKNMQGQDYGGMCCVILTVNSSVVSAGLLRIFGRDVAELPLVATCMSSRGKGYFQLLFSCVEKLLSFLNVEKIVLPAAEEAESLWINKYGFRKMSPEQLNKYMKMCYQMVRFKGASMMQKPVSLHQIVDENIIEPME